MVVVVLKNYFTVSVIAVLKRGLLSSGGKKGIESLHEWGTT
jgi:hypothetical protein